MLGLAAAGFGLLFAHGVQPPRLLAEAGRQRRLGEFTRARQILEDLRASWGGKDEARRALLGSAEQAIAATETACSGLRARIQEQSHARSWAMQIEELKHLERHGAGPAEREAAHIVRARLKEIRLGVEPLSRIFSARAAASAQRAGRRPDPLAAQGAVPVEVLTRIDRLAEQRLFARALELLRQALGSTPAARARPLRERLGRIRQSTLAAMQRLVARAQALEGAGHPDRALALLAAQAERFPGSGDLALLAHERDRLATVQASPHVPGGMAPLAGPRRGSVSLAPAAEETAEDLRSHMAASVAKALSARRGKALRVALRDGRFAELVGVAGVRPRLRDPEGTREASWRDLQPAARAHALTRLGVDARALLWAAVLTYRDGERGLAEELLARAWKTDSALAAEIQAIVQEGRGDGADVTYVLAKGAIVSRHDLELRKRVRACLRKLSSAMRGRSSRWKGLADEIGEGDTEAWLGALRQYRDALVRRAAKHPFKRIFDKLAAKRVKLDAARRHAKELIYDTVRYFYPYRPPAVDPEKAKTYWPVQQEVDARVAAVRALWEEETKGRRVPRSLRAESARYSWVRDELSRHGRNSLAAERDMAWVLSLPDEARLSLQSFCKTPAERRSYELDQRIEAYNRAVTASLPQAERREIQITNDYRRMYGHHPLAVSLKLQEAARGHSQEMSELGYFGHFSPKPGRRTPFDRMKLAGYGRGVGENCAINSSADAAHIAWLHSSGHHRNLLNPAHTEFGVGNAGRYWTQDFGRGKEYRDSPDFAWPGPNRPDGKKR